MNISIQLKKVKIIVDFYKTNFKISLDKREGTR